MPIITSLLGADFYKFTMAQVIRTQQAGVQGKFAFTNRTEGVDLAKCIDIGRIKEELAHARTLTLSQKEINYLRHCYGERRLFSEDYLWFLSTLKLPEIEVSTRNGELRIETCGEWCQVMFWETLVLNVVNELYFESLRVKDGVDSCSAESESFWRQGLMRLRKKLWRIKQLPSAPIIEFGNRRRHSGWWQGKVLEEMIDGLHGKLIGTSNVQLAMDYGLQPSGTFAHEMFMGYAAVAQSHGRNIVATHSQVLGDWRAMYGEQLSIALTDTFGSEFFFRDMDQDAAKWWTGLRHDSGDPIAFGERAISFYKSRGIEPITKQLVFSDGLTVDVIEALILQFDGRIQLAFGWGTDLTNDLGYRPLSLVMKLVEARGYDTVKLSDNPAKATGPANVVGLYKDLFGYEEGARVECRF